MRPNAGKIEHILLKFASRGNYRDVLAALKLIHDRRGIRDHGEPVAMKQAPRQFKDGGAPFQEHRFAIEYQPLGFSRDRLFSRAIAAAQRFVGRLEIRAGGAGNRAGVRADQHAFFFQGGQIAANGGCGDAQCANEFGSGNRSLARRDFADAKSPFLGQEARSNFSV